MKIKNYRKTKRLEKWIMIPGSGFTYAKISHRVTITWYCAIWNKWKYSGAPWTLEPRNVGHDGILNADWPDRVTWPYPGHTAAQQCGQRRWVNNCCHDEKTRERSRCARAAVDQALGSGRSWCQNWEHNASHDALYRRIVTLFGCCVICYYYCLEWRLGSGGSIKGAVPAASPIRYNLQKHNIRKTCCLFL